MHAHTVFSDGNQTHIKVLESAEMLGIGVIGFADHDTLPDKKTVRGLKSYSGLVKWVVGVELSSWVPKRVGGPEKGAVHILGLFVDVENPELVEFCRATEGNRLARMRRYVTHLRGLGFIISEKDVMNVATSRNIGSPHMVKALNLHQENQRVIDGLKERMSQAAKHDPALQMRYDQMIADGPNQYPYVLFMRGSSFMPAPKSDFGSLLDFGSTVKLIRSAGGLAVAAHWYLEQDKMTMADFEVVLAAGGLDGLESEDVNAILKRNVSHEVTLTIDLAKRYKVLEMASSDSHKLADLEAFAQSKAARRTVGLTKRIVERYQPDFKWSNLEK